MKSEDRAIGLNESRLDTAPTYDIAFDRNFPDNICSGDARRSIRRSPYGRLLCATRPDISRAARRNLREGEEKNPECVLFVDMV